jgi:hypothetical protein
MIKPTEVWRNVHAARTLGQRTAKWPRRSIELKKADYSSPQRWPTKSSTSGTSMSRRSERSRAAHAGTKAGARREQTETTLKTTAATFTKKRRGPKRRNNARQRKKQ